MGGLPQQMLKLGEELFNRVQIRVRPRCDPGTLRLAHSSVPGHWGRALLQSSFKAVSTARTCASELKSVSLRGASRGRALNLSIKAFWVGLTGAM